MYLIAPNLSVYLGSGEEILLTKIGIFFTIEYLYKHAGQTITYEELYKKMSGKILRMNEKYRVANVIFHLRKKIEQDVNKPQYIKNNSLKRLYVNGVKGTKEEKQMWQFLTKKTMKMRSMRRCRIFEK